MMKKTLILAAVMLFACAAMANAWVVTASWKSPAGTLYNNNLTIGNPANSLLTLPPAQDGTLVGAISKEGNLYFRFYQTAVPADTQWTILLWGNNYTAGTEGRFRVWIANAVGLDMRPWELRNAANEVVWTGAVDTTKNAETKPWIDVMLPVINATDPQMAATYTFGPVPEPGSVVALCSGLIGLVGFGIRRRK